MSSYAKILSVLKKGGQSADDFPAIRALLKKEQGKEARFGTNNPVIDAFGGGSDNDLMELTRVINDQVAPKENLLSRSKYNLLNLDKSQRPLKREVTIGYRAGDNNKPNLDFYSVDEDTGDYYADHLIRKLENQPIFWADDAAGAATKKGIPKIEDALIRERERERIFNTNNPLKPIEDIPDMAVEFRQLKDAPSGAPRFESINKILNPQGQYKPGEQLAKANEDLRKSVVEQLEGRRFFFPVKADIVEEDPTNWIGSYTENGPILSMLRSKGRRAMEERYSWPFYPNKDVFFADGSTI